MRLPLRSLRYRGDSWRASGGFAWRRGILLLLLVAIVISFTLLYRSCAVPPKVEGPEGAVEVLLMTRKFNRDAGISLCVAYGDAILPYLEESTEGYTRLYWGRNRRIARTLAQIKSEATLSVLWKMRMDDESHGQFWAAIGLVLADVYDMPIVEDEVLVQALSSHSASSAAALGILGDPEAVPFLIPALRESKVDPSFQAAVANALGLLGDENAIPPLRSALQDPDFRAPHAAFRALTLLGDSEAINLGINRLCASDVQRDELLKEIELAVGEDIGNSPTAWCGWWQRRSMRSPPVSAKALEQMRTRARNLSP